MTKIQTFEDLTAWQKAHALVLDVYKLTKIFPKEELFGLTSKMRRAAVSVPSNIAEGFTRLSSTEKIRFYNIAEASAEETRYQLILAHDLSYADTSRHQQRSAEVKRIIGGLIQSIRKG